MFAAASKLYAKVEDIPEIEFPKPRVAGRQCNHNNSVTAKEIYKRAVWYPVLDSLLQGMKHFHAKTAMKMCTLLPTKCIGASFASLGESLRFIVPSWLMDQRHARLNLNVGNASGLKYHLTIVQAL